ncbi:hypothetical protein [Pseudomonas asiatica]|uniref:Uncharacterized protein n=1 Tax=Pseudomonas asiatica TaxID=2219225 RepID=A0ABU5L4R4_9PSED|nr:hypothetical protein [Pseudomonas asiatica]MDZ5741156.1 hypothetical protein [Pseudomonas asiatica]MDZ5744754.1 hypothetical protein [Pseudomonas asiatica]MDZ5751348.1 hypothetical protein [Pseudomonas asiatica]MDZ5756520.1 hypothetical protein [Pseudomonas asiatica]
MSREHELYADSAQGRALDRRLSGEHEVHWATGITPQQAAANNRAWLAMIREQEEHQKANSRKAIAAALDKMEAMCGSGAARRTA